VHAGQHQAPSEAEVASTNVNKEVRGEVQEDVKEEPSESQPEISAENIQKEEQTAQPREPS
jgi:gas vesicle protein